MFFTNKGRVYAKKAYRIPEAGRTAKGTNLVNIIELMEGEYVTAIIPIAEFTEGEYLTMVTKRGVINSVPSDMPSQSIPGMVKYS